jgi:hypothetical protein
METLRKIPWSWVLTILWLLGSQYTAFQLVILPALFSFFLAIFAPPALILSVAMIIIPGVFSLAAWGFLFFRKKLVAIILSGVALGVGILANGLLNSIFPSN